MRLKLRSAGLPKPRRRGRGDQSAPMICRMIFDELCVLANGDIVCSCADTAALRVYGNVFRQRIEQVYNAAGYQEMRAWQLASRPESWCPVIQAQCGGRVSRASAAEGTTGRRVRLLQLEPISYCNLRCPACPIAHYESNPAYREDRADILPLDTMLDVLGQLPDLEKLLFYNFGEPFLHPQAIDYLREVRRRRPDVSIHTSTNGLPLKPAQIEALGQEALVDRIVFSIDGAREQSYRRYRVRGSLAQALTNMAALAQACRQAGTTQQVEIHWQYILFEWNDSPEELIEAQLLAQRIGVPIKWIVTHTEGASRRLTYGSPELRQLMGEREEYVALTCELRMQELWGNHGVASGRYAAQLSTPQPRLRARPGAQVSLELRVRNLSAESWQSEGQRQLRLGFKLRSPQGRSLGELPGIPLPPRVEPGQELSLAASIEAPERPGCYQLFVDVVEERVCWFSERGSAGLLIELETLPGSEF